jgi:hypothetical protein
MSVPPPQVSRDAGDLGARHPDLSLFARIEALIGEEEALLLIPARDRKQHEHDRLREIGDELDRIWERLRERARRLGSDRAAPKGGGPADP